MLETQRYFANATRGEQVSPPGPQTVDSRLLAYTGRDPS